MANRFADASTIDELLDRLIRIGAYYGLSEKLDTRTVDMLRTQARERLNQILAAGSDLDDVVNKVAD